MKNPEDFNSLIELMDYFDTEKKCIEYFQYKRWNGTPTCPHCEHTKVYCFSDGIRYKCAKCRKQFTVKVGTIFEDSKIPLRKWFMATYLLINHKKGISSYQLARDIDVTQKTAWFMLHRLRYKLGFDNDPDEKMDGVVEVDETFVGGKNKNRHRKKKVANSQGRSFKDKTPVLGMLQRDGKVKTIVIPNTQAYIIQPILYSTIREGTHLITDEWKAYHGLNSYYEHDVVHHGRGYYGSGEIHTNSIEGFWAWIKRMIMGIYHLVSPKHLQRYADEAAFRYNTRKMSIKERLIFALSIKDEPFKYQQLIGKV